MKHREKRAHTPAAFSCHLAGFDIALHKRGKFFAVRYGLQTVENLTYEEAALELGASILHALACEGGIGLARRH